jgi:carbon monoxide dehydrogenase subunit G
MKVEGTRTFAAPRVVVWEVLNDPNRLAKTMPGVESFDVLDDKHWKANVKIPLGLGGLKMSIDFTKTEERAPEYSQLLAKGNGVGAMMNMQTSFNLAEEGEATTMRWEADVRIAGPVGSMGQRVLQPIVNQQVRSVLDALEKQVQEAKAEGGELKDAGPPAEGVANPEGTSGADEGVNPLSPEGYSNEPQGPTTSTEDRG